MIVESEVLQLPPRFVCYFWFPLVITQASDRRTVTRAKPVSDPIHVDTSFIFGLGNYVNARQEEITITVARFFYLFIKECSLLETYEVDNFILRNAGVLSSW
jgi:hypothetical protein